MTNRLMTPFCFASVMAAMLFAEGALAANSPPAQAAPKDNGGAPAAAPVAPPLPSVRAKDGGNAS